MSATSSASAFEELARVVSGDLDDEHAARLAGVHLLARLKAENRAANDAARTARTRSTDARLAMDNTHLGLQNLLYQRRHVEGEIEKCRQFASIYEDIPLHEVEDFLQLAPAEARSPEVTADEHQLMLNRLSFELSERQRLDERKRALTTRRDALLKSVKDQQGKLDMISDKFDALTKLAVELQGQLLVAPTNDAHTPRPPTP